MKSFPLKIKFASLAAEIRIIKAEEARLERLITQCPTKNAEQQGWKAQHIRDLWEIRNHRYQDVRTDARDTLLAYSFLRGRMYKRIEPLRYSDPDWTNIERMILKYGKSEGKPQDLKQSFEQWKQSAGQPIDPLAPKAPRPPRVKKPYVRTAA